MLRSLSARPRSSGECACDGVPPRHEHCLGDSGEHEERQVVHPVRYRGQVIVIGHVPAEVCSVGSGEV